MNKKFKKYVDDQLTLYQNEEFLKELKLKQKERSDEKGVARPKKVALCCSIGAAVLTLIILLMCVFLIKPVNDTDFPRTYLEEDQQVEACELAELNEDLRCVSFHLGDSVINKHTDERHKETLFYTVSYISDDMLVQILFTVVTNSNYKADGADIEYDRDGLIASYELRYEEEATFEDDIYIFSEKGIISTEYEIIVIDGGVVGLEEDSHFTEILNEIIRTK